MCLLLFAQEARLLPTGLWKPSPQLEDLHTRLWTYLKTQVLNTHNFLPSSPHPPALDPSRDLSKRNQNLCYRETFWKTKGKFLTIHLLNY